MEKKNKTRLARAAMTLLLALLTTVGAWGQETLTVYDGTKTSSCVPVWGLWADNSLQCEMVYPASVLEDMAGGTISSLQFYSSNTSVNVLTTGTSNCWNGTFTVFMKEVESTSISKFSGTTGSTIVCEAQIGVTDGVMTINLNPTYNYDGGNLLIGIYYVTEGAYKSIDWLGSSVDDASIYGRSGQNYSVNQANFLPKTTFFYEPVSTGCDMPTSIAVSDITHNSATVTWEGEGNTWNLRYKASTDADYTIVEGLTSKSYNLTGLTENTSYSVGVQTDCGGSTSNFRSTSFTTENPCAAPTVLVVSDLTPSSATLSWTPGYQETEWTVKYKKSGETIFTEETVSGTPTITLSSLSVLTTYDVQVYNCTDDGSPYLSGTFTTKALIPLVEGFNTSSIPTGWALYTGLLENVMNGTALSSASYGWSFGMYNGVFDNHARVNIYGTSCNKWLVMPTTKMEDNVQLTFDLALTAYSGNLGAPQDTGTDDKFVVLITTDGGTTWTVLRQWDNAGSEYVYNNIACSAVGQNVSIDLSSYAGQNIAIAFYGESTVQNADNNLHIDNVSIDYIPDCAKPTGLTVSSVTAHEATISWTSEANAWQIQVGEEDPINVTTNPYTLTGLTAETAYSVKVRTDCGGTYSEWTNPVSFTTGIACQKPTNVTVSNITGHGATVTWDAEEGDVFEYALALSSVTKGDAKVPSDLQYQTVSAIPLTLTDLDPETEYVFYLRKNCGSEDGYSQIVTKTFTTTVACTAPTGITLSNITGHGVTVTWDEVEGAMYQYVMVKNNYYDPGNINWSYSAEVHTLTWDNLEPETGYTFALRKDCSSAEEGFSDIVTKTFTTTVACPAPTNLAATLTPGDGTVATLSWTEPGDATNWVLEYGTASDFTGATSVNVSDNPSTNLTGLTLETTYYARVKAVCGGEDGESAWSNTVSFHVGYCTPNPTSHDGSGITGVSFGTGDYVVTNGDGTASLPASAPYYGDYTSMIGAVQAGIESTIAITTGTNTYPYTFVIWVDLDNSLSFEDNEILYIGKATTGMGTHNATITIPATQATGDYRMRIYGADSYFSSFYNGGNPDYTKPHDPCSEGSYRHAHDYTLRVLEAPSCLPAGNVTVAPESITSTSAVISWTNYNGDEATYTVMQGENVLTTTAVNSYTLNGLTAGTYYPAGTFTIVSNCDETMIANVPAFTTECDVIATFPWTENFEGFGNNTVPMCWDNSASTSYISNSNSSPNCIWGVVTVNDNNMIKMENYWVQTGTALINTPTIVLPSEGEYYLTFDYAHNATCGAFAVKVSVDSGATFTELASYTKGSGSSHDEPGEFTPAAISLADYAGKAIILQFFANANYGSGAIFVDNVRVGSPIEKIKFAKEGYATYYNSGHDVVLPAGMKAKIVTASASDGTLTYETIADGSGTVKNVPSKTAVMLQVAPAADNQTIFVDLATATTGTYTGNKLHGSDERVNITTLDDYSEDNYYYMLSYDSSGANIGWYWDKENTTGSGFWSGAHKAWLVLPKSLFQGSGAPFLGLPGWEETTGIVPVGVNPEDGEWYTLQGLKIGKKPTTKGVYIHNGRKVIVK